MMFKVISMHSKPCKHAKYNEILRNTLKTNDLFKKPWCFRFLSKTYICSKAHNLHDLFSMPQTQKKTKPINII